MPEEFDGAGADTGMDGGDSGGPEPSGEGAQASAGTPATPNYMTREQFEEAMGGYSQSHQERLDGVSKSFGGMQDMIKQLVEAQKPQPPPLVPDAKALENIDAHGMRELLSNITGKYDGTIKELREELQKTQNDWKQRAEAEKIHGHFRGQVDSTAKQYPMLQSQYGQRLLQDLTIAGIENSRGDYRKVNVPAMGQALNAFLDAEVKARVAAMTRAAQAQGGTAQGGGQAAPRAPAKGAPTKPASNAGGGVTMKNFAQRQREMVAKHFPGGED